MCTEREMSNKQQSPKKLYNQTQILNWTREEQIKHKVCYICQQWGTIALKGEHGNYYFVCADHWKVDPSYMDQ